MSPLFDDRQLATGRVFLFTLILNLLIVILELAGGYLSGSLALISDAVHNLGDVVALALAWFAFRLSRKAASPKRTFGYKRAEIIAALFNASLLAGSSVFLMVQAGNRLMNPIIPDAGIMLWVGLAGLIANLISVVLLHGFRKGNLNARAAYFHLLGDSLSSILVVGGAVSLNWLRFSWIDPVLSFVICLFILLEAIKIIHESLGILMQNTPPSLNLVQLRDAITSLEGVRDIHHLHAWQLNDNDLHLEFHLELERDLVVSETGFLREKIVEIVKEGFGISHLTIQFEFGFCRNPGLVVERQDGLRTTDDGQQESC